MAKRDRDKKENRKKLSQVANIQCTKQMEWKLKSGVYEKEEKKKSEQTDSTGLIKPFLWFLIN